MPSTLLLDQQDWDLLLDASGNIAVASEPYSLAQDAASAVRTFRGECYWNVLIGIPYLTDILGKNPSLALAKELFVTEARTVEGVGTADCFLTGITNRSLSGQIQVTSERTGQTVAATFTVINPQGGP